MPIHHWSGKMETPEASYAAYTPIVRALLKKAPLMLLDEPTSALDTPTEREAIAAIHELGRQNTIVIITHRLSTLCSADVIVVLQSGRLVEQGTHDQFMAPRGAYHRFLHTQQGHQVDPAGRSKPF